MSKSLINNNQSISEDLVIKVKSRKQSIIKNIQIHLFRSMQKSYTNWGLFLRLAAKHTTLCQNTGKAYSLLLSITIKWLWDVEFIKE